MKRINLSYLGLLVIIAGYSMHDYLHADNLLNDVQRSIEYYGSFYLGLSLITTQEIKRTNYAPIKLVLSAVLFLFIIRIHSHISNWYIIDYDHYWFLANSKAVSNIQLVITLITMTTGVWLHFSKRGRFTRPSY